MQIIFSNFNLFEFVFLFILLSFFFFSRKYKGIEPYWISLSFTFFFWLIFRNNFWQNYNFIFFIPLICLLFLLFLLFKKKQLHFFAQDLNLAGLISIFILFCFSFPLYFPYVIFLPCIFLLFSFLVRNHKFRKFSISFVLFLLGFFIIGGIKLLSQNSLPFCPNISGGGLNGYIALKSSDWRSTYGNILYSSDVDAKGEIYFPSSGEYIIWIWAKGEIANGEWPWMNVYLDEQLIEKIYVASSYWKAYPIALNTNVGTKIIKIEFINDYFFPEEGQDRNLYLGNLEIICRR